MHEGKAAGGVAGTAGSTWVERLLDRVPHPGWWLGPGGEPPPPHVAFGYLAGALREAMQAGDHEGNLVAAGMALLAEMAESSEPETLNLLAVGALEGLVGCPEVIRAFRPAMSRRLRCAFDRMLVAWYGDDPHGDGPYDLDVPPDEDMVRRATERVMALERRS